MTQQPDDPIEVIRRCTIDLSFQIISLIEEKNGRKLSMRQIELVDTLAKDVCATQWDQTHNEIIPRKGVKLL